MARTGTGAVGAAKWVYAHAPARAGDAALRAAAALLRVVVRLRFRDRGVVLCYHVVEHRDGLPGPALVPTMSPEAFDAQLRHLARAYRPVPTGELRRHVATRRRGRRIPVAITFDDDHQSNLSGAAPVLRRRRIPATFFLTGSSLDGPHEFWWQTLQRAIDAVGLEDVERTAGRPLRDIVAGLTAGTPGEREAAAAAFLPEGSRAVPPSTGLRRHEVAALATDGLDVGFHTRDHPSLPLLDDGALEEAALRGREELEAILGRPLREFAYPYGHHDERVVRVAAAAGFEAAYTTRQRAVTATSPALEIGRLEPGDVPPGRFAWLVVKTLLTGP
jgi:peptidoglycan/xylan/chitin deacetylase (PgdA/CDA1 family)